MYSKSVLIFLRCNQRTYRRTFHAGGQILEGESTKNVPENEDIWDHTDFFSACAFTSHKTSKSPNFKKVIYK